MTAIVAIAKDGVVWMGGDSAGSDGVVVQTRLDPKVFIRGEFLFGYSGSFRIGQLLQYMFEPPVVSNCSGMAYMVKHFIPELREVLNDNIKCLQDDGSGDHEMLVGHKGCLYSIESDFQVARFRNSYHATGSGSDFALGSLHTTEGLPLRSEDRVHCALEAAAEFSVSVRPPFEILSLQGC